MVEEKMDSRPANLRQFFPWFELFQAFKVALDPKKLLLAAAGIVAMAAWWWICSAVFFAGASKPVWPTDYGQQIAKYQDKGKTEAEARQEAWNDFKIDLHQYDLLLQTAGTEPVQPIDAGDLAGQLSEFEPIKQQLDKSAQITRDGKQIVIIDEPGVGRKEFVITPKKYGEMRTLPIFENRGPNPYLLVTGQAAIPANEGPVRWFINDQIPVLIEPVVKFMMPVQYLLHTNIGFRNFLYFVLVLVGTLAVWALFGGAITRMAVLQIARKEKIGMNEALRFTVSRWASFFSAPLLPLVLVAALSVLLIIFGFFHMIPLVGDIIVDGLGWPLVLIAGLVMAVVLVGLVGWPMMYATISTEGSDSFDALSRSYSYVYQSPWNYIWYCAVALVYGAAVVFFVGFMGSLLVYLGKWGVSQTPWIQAANRDPRYLFEFAPTSFGWRALLQGNSPIGTGGWYWWNYVGAGLVAFWLYLTFLLVLGFGYSFFWTAGTIIYLLMRRKVDDTDLDEVYVDDDDTDETYPIPAPVPAMAGGPSLTMVDPPTLKTSVTVGPSGPPAPVTESIKTDGAAGSSPS